MKTISFVTFIIGAFLFGSFSGCAGGPTFLPTPTGQMQFQSYMAHEKIPLTCNIIIPESSRNYENTFMGVPLIIGPLFTENVPLALGEVMNSVSIESSTPSDITITAHLINFSVSMPGILPAVNATVTYELSTNDGLLIKKLASEQSYKSTFLSPSGPELYKMVVLQCLEDLNSQLIGQKSFLEKYRGNKDSAH